MKKLHTKLLLLMVAAISSNSQAMSSRLAKPLANTAKASLPASRSFISYASPNVTELAEMNEFKEANTRTYDWKPLNIKKDQIRLKKSIADTMPKSDLTNTLQEQLNLETQQLDSTIEQVKLDIDKKVLQKFIAIGEKLSEKITSMTPEKPFLGTGSNYEYKMDSNKKNRKDNAIAQKQNLQSPGFKGTELNLVSPQLTSLSAYKRIKDLQDTKEAANNQVPVLVKQSSWKEGLEYALKLDQMYLDASLKEAKNLLQEINEILPESGRNENSELVELD